MAAKGASIVDGALAPDERVIPEAATQLWEKYQEAAATLGEGIAQLGFLDIAVCGIQSSGKSTLLSSVCGLKLPIGGETVTKCPIRITVDARNTETRLEMPGGGSTVLERSEGLTTEIYQQALQDLSNGEMTTKELRIFVQGRNGHPPLNLLDLPGFIITGAQTEQKVKDNAAAVDEMVQAVLGGGSARRAVLPIMTMTPTSDINNSRLEVVAGRPFLVVLTFTSHLLNDKPLFEAVMNKRKLLEAKGCKGFYMFALDNSRAEANAAWYDYFCEHNSSITYNKAEIMACCGIDRLRARIQELQLHHMLGKRNEIMARVAKRMEMLKPQLQNGELSEKELERRVINIIELIQQEVSDAHAHGKTTLNIASTNIDAKYCLAIEAKKIVDAYAGDLALTVLAGVTQTWADLNPNDMADTNLLSNWQIIAWNAVTPGLFKALSEEYLGAAANRMLDMLKNFVTWRVEKRFADAGMGPAAAQFSSFWPTYANAKSAALQQEKKYLEEELNDSNKLAMVAPWVYIAIEAKAIAAKNIVDYFPALSKDMTKNAEQLQLSTVELLEYSKTDFENEAKRTQIRTRLLALMIIMQLVEGLSRRMTNIILARTYRVREDSSPVYNNVTPASITLKDAFLRYLVDKEVNFKDLISASQQQTQKDFDALKGLHEALGAFSKHVTEMPQPPKIHKAKVADMGPKTPEAAKTANSNLSGDGVPDAETHQTNSNFRDRMANL